MRQWLPRIAGLSLAIVAGVVACTGEDAVLSPASGQPMGDASAPEGSVAVDAGMDAPSKDAAPKDAAPPFCAFEEAGRDFVICPGANDAGVCATSESCCVSFLDASAQPVCVAKPGGCPGALNRWECEGTESCQFGGQCCSSKGALESNTCPFKDTTRPVGQCSSNPCEEHSQMCRNSGECSAGKTCRQVSVPYTRDLDVTFGWCY